MRCQAPLWRRWVIALPVVPLPTAKMKLFVNALRFMLPEA
jgi:hypothetical protein